MSKKRKQAKPIYRTQTSKFIFAGPGTLLLFCFLFLVLNGIGTTFFLMLGFTCLYFLSTTFFYHTKELVVTNNKVYIFEGKEKILGWTFSDEFHVVDFTQSNLGKKFNYGTLFLSNKKNQVYLFKFIDNPFQTYEEIIVQYEKVACEVDPEYKPHYERKTTSNYSNDGDTIIKNGIVVDRVKGDEDEE